MRGQGVKREIVWVFCRFRGCPREVPLTAGTNDAGMCRYIYVLDASQREGVHLRVDLPGMVVLSPIYSRNMGPGRTTLVRSQLLTFCPPHTFF